MIRTETLSADTSYHAELDQLIDAAREEGTSISIIDDCLWLFAVNVHKHPPNDIINEFYCLVIAKEREEIKNWLKDLGTIFCIAFEEIEDNGEISDSTRKELLFQCSGGWVGISILIIMTIIGAILFITTPFALMGIGMIITGLATFIIPIITMALFGILSGDGKRFNAFNPVIEFVKSSLLKEENSKTKDLQFNETNIATIFLFIDICFALYWALPLKSAIGSSILSLIISLSCDFFEYYLPGVMFKNLLILASVVSILFAANAAKAFATGNPPAEILIKKSPHGGMLYKMTEGLLVGVSLYFAIKSFDDARWK